MTNEKEELENYIIEIGESQNTRHNKQSNAIKSDDLFIALKTKLINHNGDNKELDSCFKLCQDIARNNDCKALDVIGVVCHEIGLDNALSIEELLQIKREFLRESNLEENSN